MNPTSASLFSRILDNISPLQTRRLASLKSALSSLLGMAAETTPLIKGAQGIIPKGMRPQHIDSPEAVRR
jgi:hypothetical protein